MADRKAEFSLTTGGWIRIMPIIYNMDCADKSKNEIDGNHGRWTFRDVTTTDPGATGRRNLELFLFLRNERSDELNDLNDIYNLYLNFLKRSFLQATPSSFSTPFGEVPSITPRTPLPCSDWARITSVGLAVAQKRVQTS